MLLIVRLCSVGIELTRSNRGSGLSFDENMPCSAALASGAVEVEDEGWV